VYKEVGKEEVLKYLDFGSHKKFKMSGGRGAVMLLNKVLKFEEYDDNLQPISKNSIGVSSWSVDMGDKNLIIEYNPGFDVFKEGVEEKYAGLPLSCYKADLYVYGIGRINRYCRILDFSTLDNYGK
jgi:hypothetical protein